MPLRRVYCRRIREPPLTIERRREQFPKAAGRSDDRAPSAHLRVLFPRYRSLPRTRGPKPYRSPAPLRRDRRDARKPRWLLAGATPDPEASPRVGIMHCPPCRQAGLSSSWCSPRANGCCRFGEATFAATDRKERDAPQGVVGGSAIEAATLVVATLEG